MILLKYRQKSLPDIKQIRYNSTLALVVYCPIGFKIEYAIWSKKQHSVKSKNQINEFRNWFFEK